MAKKFKITPMMLVGAAAAVGAFLYFRSKKGGVPQLQPDVYGMTAASSGAGAGAGGGSGNYLPSYYGSPASESYQPSYNTQTTANFTAQMPGTTQTTVATGRPSGGTSAGSAPIVLPSGFNPSRIGPSAPSGARLTSIAPATSASRLLSHSALLSPTMTTQLPISRAGIAIPSIRYFR